MKSILKRIIWTLSRHEPSGQPDICIAATRRGGSTMVMEIIAAGGPLRYIDQPFSIHSADSRHRKMLPHPRNGQFVSVSEDEYRRIREFMTRLSQGDEIANAAWDIRKDTWHARTSRVVFKIVDAKTLIPRLSDDLTLDVLWFIRHPIPTALSIIRNDWGHTADAFLSDRNFVDRFLQKDLETYCRNILKSEDRLAIEVMGWALENRPVYDDLRERPSWKVLSYETLVSERKRSIDGLVNWLNLPDRESMLKQAGRASSSSRRLATRVDPASDSVDQVGSWRSSLDVSRAERVMEIPQTLGIPLYSAGDDFPDLGEFADRIPGREEERQK